jgi:erythromycin esterase
VEVPDPLRLLSAITTLTLVVLAAACAAPPGTRFEAPPLTDEDKAWLVANAVPIRSIDPRERDYADLQSLKKLIGDARVVQLGEQSHGDGAAFLAKCRLIQFLHREMGFDVLVWESGMFDCRLADRALRNPTVPVEQAWPDGVFAIWGISAQVRPVLDYIREAAATERPLEVAGFDCQMSSGKVGRWLDALAAHFAPLGDDHPALEVLDAFPARALKPQQRRGDLELLERATGSLEKLATLADKDREKLAAAHGEGEAAFMRRTIDDAAATVRMYLAIAEQNGSTYAGSHLNHRDQRMGENLIWLANERYKGRKLVVWAATMHAVHDVQAIRPKEMPDIYKGGVTAGTVAKGALGDALYTIAFDAHQGEAAPAFEKDASALDPSPPGSLGDHLSRLDSPFLYVDLKSAPSRHWLRGEFVMRPLGYSPMNAVWSRQVDGVFFTHTMFRSTRQGLAPGSAVLTVEGSIRQSRER